MCECACLNANKLILFLNFRNIFELSSGSKSGLRRVGRLSEPPEEQKKTFHNNNADSNELENNKFATHSL